MQYSVVFPQQIYEEIIAHLFDGDLVERAGYLLCGTSVTESEQRFLARRFIPAEDAHVRRATPDEIVIESASYTAALAEADRDGAAFFFIHSQPRGRIEHSKRDKTEIPKLLGAAYVRVHNKQLHGSIIFDEGRPPEALVFAPDHRWIPIDRVRILGDRFHFWGIDRTGAPLPTFFERQVGAFGEDVQRVLRGLHIGIVGYGGTGSSVGEQLIRLGVGELSVVEFDVVHDTNVTRIYGSGIGDEGTDKVSIAKRTAEIVGFGTIVHTHNRPITDEEACRALRDCDLIFCCTDDNWGRSILTKVAVYYYIPVIDMAVKLGSDGVNSINDAFGRVTVLLPGHACLYCRKRIDPRRVAAEWEAAQNTSYYQQLRGQGYLPDLGQQEPAVIFLTTTVAAGAVTEFFRRLTGAFGNDSRPSEILYRFMAGDVRTNDLPGLDDCFCGDRAAWGRGDTTPFLGLGWSQ